MQLMKFYSVEGNNHIFTGLVNFKLYSIKKSISHIHLPVSYNFPVFSHVIEFLLHHSFPRNTSYAFVGALSHHNIYFINVALLLST